MSIELNKDIKNVLFGKNVLIGCVATATVLVSTAAIYFGRKYIRSPEHERAHNIQQNLQRFNEITRDPDWIYSRNIHAFDLELNHHSRQAAAENTDHVIYVSSSNPSEEEEILLPDGTSRPMTDQERAERNNQLQRQPYLNRNIEALSLAGYNDLPELDNSNQIRDDTLFPQPALPQAARPNTNYTGSSDDWSDDNAPIPNTSNRAPLSAQKELYTAGANLGYQHTRMDLVSRKRGKKSAARAAAANRAWASAIQHIGPKNVAKGEQAIGRCVRKYRELKKEVKEKGVRQITYEKAHQLKESVSRKIRGLEAKDNNSEGIKPEQQIEPHQGQPGELSFLENQIAKNNELLASEITLGKEYLKVVDALIESGNEGCIDGAHFNDGVASFFEKIGSENAATLKEAFGELMLSLEDTEVRDITSEWADMTDPTAVVPKFATTAVVSEAITEIFDDAVSKLTETSRNSHVEDPLSGWNDISDWAPVSSRTSTVADPSTSLAPAETSESTSLAPAETSESTSLAPAETSGNWLSRTAASIASWYKSQCELAANAGSSNSSSSSSWSSDDSTDFSFTSPSTSTSSEPKSEVPDYVANYDYDLIFDLTYASSTSEPESSSSTSPSTSESASSGLSVQEQGHVYFG